MVLTKNIKFIFAEHKENIPKEVLEKSHVSELCTICNEPVYLTDLQFAFDEKGNRAEEAIEKLSQTKISKYFATSCFMRLNEAFGALIIKETMALHALHHAKESRDPKKELN